MFNNFFLKCIYYIFHYTIFTEKNLIVYIKISYKCLYVYIFILCFDSRNDKSKFSKKFHTLDFRPENKENSLCIE